MSAAFGRSALVVVALLAACNTHVDEERLPIGNACNTSGQCGTGKYFCDTTHANGYCKAICAKDGDCPAGAVCVGAGMILSGACEKTCASASDCRAGDSCLTGDASAAFCAPPNLDAGSD